MIVVGLTGGIGCGKTTVANLFASRGVAIVDADQVARDVVLPESEGFAAVVQAFGPDVVAPDGTLDRKKLGAVVFADENRRRELNQLLHPRIAAESAARLAAITAEGHGFALYDAALLVENGIHRAMGALIVVTAQPEVQRARVMARDAITRAEVDARIAAQLPLAQKVAAATFVVDNSDGLERLRTRVADLYAELVLAYGPPARVASS
jgi:dephospho-CoA kinase